MASRKNSKPDKYLYTVKPDKERDGWYFVNKYVHGGVFQDVYRVHIKSTDEAWCDCPGYSRQKYDKQLHKHILLVRAFLEHRDAMGVNGQPAVSLDFKLNGLNEPVLQPRSY